MSRKLPDRVLRREIPTDSRWVSSAVYTIEEARITEWLQDSADHALSYQRANDPKEKVLRLALSESTKLTGRLHGVFASKEVQVEPNRSVIVAGRQGDLERQAGSRSLLFAFNVLRWVAFFAELAIFVAMMIVEALSPIVLIQGFLLAASAFILGYGVGMIAIQWDQEEKRGYRVNVLLAILGLVGVVVVVALRFVAATSGTEAIFVVVITGVLALLIAVFEAVHLIRTDKYEASVRNMYMFQQWQATLQHRQAYGDGLWAKIYQDRVQQLVGDVEDIKEEIRVLGEGVEDAASEGS